MSLKILIQLSHFVTLMFGIALGVTLCILYQFKIGIFIEDLTSVVLLLVFLSAVLRAYTLYLMKKNNLRLIFFEKHIRL
mgnify:CR=1 FL=1|tara:strand:+ start:1098 stop:1334 length:237 start_codon:yes stop_codon:yes gene_type:complete